MTLVIAKVRNVGRTHEESAWTTCLSRNSRYFRREQSEELEEASAFHGFRRRQKKLEWLNGLPLGHDEYHPYDQEYPDCVTFKMIQFKMRFHGFLYSIVSPGMNLQVCVLTHQEIKKEDDENASILGSIAEFREREFDALELERFLRLT